MLFVQIQLCLAQKHFERGVLMTHQRRAELLLSIVWYGAAIGLVLAAIWFLLPRLTPFLLGTGLAVLMPLRSVMDFTVPSKLYT